MVLTSIVDSVRNDWMSWPSWLYFVEGLLIVFGNAVTISVFWKRRNFVKRASFLLINLAVADLLVGVALLINKAVGLPRSETVSLFLLYIVLLALCFNTSASVGSLTVIAVERAFAVAKPLKHRTAPTSYYRGAIIFVWLVAIILTTTFTVTFTGRLDLRFIPFTLAVVLLLIINLSYAVIWRYSTQRPMNNHNHANEQIRAKKLAKTLAIVTFLSLATWLPLQVLFVATSTVDVFDGYVELYMAILWLCYSNSLLNPFVYAMRIPDFRQELKRTFLAKLFEDRRGTILIGNVNTLRFGPHGSYRSTGAGLTENHDQVQRRR